MRASSAEAQAQDVDRTQDRPRGFRQPSAKTFSDYELYGLIPDHATITTPGWDEWCLSALDQFPNRVAVISPSHTLGPHVDMPFVSNAWIKATGWFAFPDMYHYAWPVLNGLIGEMSGILHAPETAFQVDHEGDLPANQDKRAHDVEMFMMACSKMLPNIVARVRTAMYPNVGGGVVLNGF
jgi:hypothetical protein